MFPLFLFGRNSTPQLYDLRCENLVEPLAIDNVQPRFSWKITSGVNGFRQSAYQLVVLCKNSDGIEETVWDSGKVKSDKSVLVRYDGQPLDQSSIYYWKVRIWDGKGKVSQWSEENIFGIGLLEWEDWKGEYIGLPDPQDQRISPMFKQTFDYANDGGKLLMHVNTLGYHEVYINGERVSEQVLAPAVSQLNKRSLAVTYDITRLLAEGTNTVVLWLGQGWYKQNLYSTAVHSGPLVRAQIEKVDGNNSETILVTDGSWQATRSGYSSLGSWHPHQFGGEKIDANAVFKSMSAEDLDKDIWQKARVFSVPEHIVSPQMCEPNIIRDVIPAREVFRDRDGNWIVDMGTTLTGWAAISVPDQEKGRELLFEYADHYDGSEFSTELGHYDIYITSGTADVFCNKFNYHSFRYIRIRNMAGEVSPEDITGYAIWPSFTQTGSFECSDTDMNAIHDLIRHTFTNLSLGGYIVDCHHIERLGYGGDGHASANAVQTMFGVSGLFNNWLQAWGDCIRPDGGLPHSAPNPLKAGGGPYWCAFIVGGPWSVYTNYGDRDILEKYYPYMQSWLGFAESHMTDGLLQRWPDTSYRDWFLGDWACPDGVNAGDGTSVAVVTNCVLSECYSVMGQIASILNIPADSRDYTEKKKNLDNAIFANFYDPENNRLGTGTQIDMVYPLLVGAVPDELVPEIVARLKEDTRAKLNDHLGVGLVGVTKLTEWAIEAREADFMYRLLKQRDYPGYLYMIDNGATSTWEYWNGIRSRIHNCYNGIGTWFYRSVGGIRPDPADPGYSHVFIDPVIPDGIEWARTQIDTPYGDLSVHWQLMDGHVEMEVIIPVGSRATVIVPGQVAGVKQNGKKIKTGKGTLQLESGTYTVAYKQ
ncbi:MAG: glycoside hydrolase family 78 protein [Alistipes sp.]|nr:glycoside hydrolase family 78 protein [Alistipes sp.]